MTVDAIKEAIAELPEDERHSLAAWLNLLEYDEWDKQMVEDFSPGGRGYHLVEKVKRDIAGASSGPSKKVSRNAASEVSIQDALRVLGSVRRVA